MDELIQELSWHVAVGTLAALVLPARDPAWPACRAAAEPEQAPYPSQGMGGWGAFRCTSGGVIPTSARG